MKLLGLLFILFSLSLGLELYASFYDRKLDLLEKGRKHRKQEHSCETYCPKERAIPYVEELSTAMTYYIQNKLWSNFTCYTSPTATMEVIQHSDVAGCLPAISGCLNPIPLWGLATQYDFIPIGPPKWNSNGVIVIRGKERVKQATEVTFIGEVYRYYLAYEGCDYQLEMVVGTDQRCTGCEICDPFTFNDFE
jgi:hypothetical protein